MRVSIYINTSHNFIDFWASHRVRTEIGYQKSRTFPGLFKDYLHFFQVSFFIDSNSPNTTYTQDFCPIQDHKRIPF